MNETECSNLIESVKWTEPGSLISLAILEFINVLVIVGNCLVIAAVFCSNKLRSVTNFFIVNLAVADLLVGLAVLPFSATWEVFKVWIFGDVWCRIWLAVDVWMCTASILNLCAISLDRYVAVTRPVTYPSIMSTKKAKSLIAGIWVLSFVICFPPLVGWKDQKTEVDSTYIRGNHTLFYATTTTTTTTTSTTTTVRIITTSSSSSSSSTEINETPLETSSSSEILSPDDITSSSSSSSSSLEPIVVSSTKNPLPCPWKCELTNDRGYVLYSALGSFYIPMFVMLFFYWRIYRAAVRTTRAINQGFKTTKGSEGKMGNRFDETRLTLRMHRGRPCNNTQRIPLPVQSGDGSSLSVNSSSIVNIDDISPRSVTPKRTTSMRLSRHRHEKVSITVSYASSENMSEANSPPYSLITHSPLSTCDSVSNDRTTNFKTSLYEIGETTFNLDSGTNHMNKGYDLNSAQSPLSKCKKRLGKRNIKFQVKRFRMETKAAKTLAIIVGGFIFCWMPFFTIYLIRAFCQQCIQPLLFSVLFWLGYCNSAINPVIYALFSNEFRIAFKRILFRCVCTRSAYRASENFQMIAARTCLAPVNFHKTISGVTEHDLDEFS